MGRHIFALSVLCNFSQHRLQGIWRRISYFSAFSLQLLGQEVGMAILAGWLVILMP
jgi:hypothetical protein